MVSALMILFLGCWLAGQSGVSGQLPAPGPAISVSPSRVIAPGGAVTIRCQCRCGGRRLFLFKGGIKIRELDAARDGGEFTIPNARWEHGGFYSCRSHSESEPPDWLLPSNIVWIFVTEFPVPIPSISVRPSGVIAPGGAVTIRCQCRCGGRRLFLYKDGIEIRELDSAQDGGEFTIPSAKREDGGYYMCRSHSRSEPPNWWYPSDIVRIIVAELSYAKPSISLSFSGGVALEGAVTIQCRGRHQNVRFLLYKDGNTNALQDVETAGEVAEFPIRNVSWRDAGNYSCYYYHHSYPATWSHPSDPVELVVAGGTDPIQPGAAPNPISPVSAGPGGTVPTQSGAETKPTTLSSAGPGGLESPTSAPPGLISHFIAGVSAAAAVLLLLLMAFVCFRKARARKGAAPRPSSTSPAGALKAPAQQDPVYTSIDEGKKPQTLPQEPDPGADRLTYAELDDQALQAKRGGPAPAPEPAQPSVYAVINVSRGPPQ